MRKLKKPLAEQEALEAKPKPRRSINPKQSAFGEDINYWELYQKMLADYKKKDRAQ